MMRIRPNLRGLWECGAIALLATLLVWLAVLA